MPRSVELARTTRRGGSVVAHLVTETGDAYSLQFTPETADLGGFGWKIGAADRQGRKPLTRRDALQTRTYSFSHQVMSRSIVLKARPGIPGSKDGELTVHAGQLVRELTELADSGKKVRMVNVSEGIETAGWWYPAVTVRLVQRDEGQQIKQAELSWTMTEVVDERPAIAKTPPPPPPPKAATSAGGQKDYTVVRGDSLWKIAVKFLGKGERWREIYDLNRDRLQLKPPEMYRGLLTVWIYPGQVMKIPAR